MTHLQQALLVFVVRFAVSFAGKVHECDDGDCYINCTSFGIKGCSYLDAVDTSKAKSAIIDCTSLSPYAGGCQLTNILCPLNGNCTINCNDYYGCYATNITAGSATTDSSLTLNCNYPDSSCTDTIINAPYINTLNINCIGFNNDPSSSLSSTTCHNMMIDANYIRHSINFHCSSDYSCSNNILYANNSQSDVTIRAIGLYAFYSNTIYAPQSSNLSLFCGSEAYTIYKNNEFGGCTASTLYIPSYSARNAPRATIQCEGEGCYNLDIYSINGALDLDITLNGCSECDKTSCIHEWNMHCGSDYQTQALFSGDLCIGNQDDCNCKHAVNTMNTAFIQNDMICDIFEIDYICDADSDCIIDCSADGLFSDGCRDKMIHGADAASLSVICDKTEEGETCSNARISCPNTEDTTCNIVCNGHNACFELEIHATKHTAQLNISCTDKDACSYIEVNAVDVQQISMDCVVSDACHSFNIYANNTDILRLKCEAKDINDISSSAYAACNNFNIYASDNTQMIDVQCNGDFSCYYANIYGERAYNMRVYAEGQYALYYGEIYGGNIESNFSLFCRSEFGEQSCYRSSVYAPQYDDLDINNRKRLYITCFGDGCYYLNLYAVNGWSDVNVEIDGCSECDSVNDCVQNWYMHCQDATSIFDGTECDTSKCDCAAMKQDVIKTFTNNPYSECGLFAPDIVCDIDTECVIDCEEYKDGCNDKIISGSNANSLVINCNNKAGCIGTQIYCPTDKNSRCDVKCMEEQSCYLTRIYGDEYNLINVDCLAVHSCLNTSIAAPNANAINLLCIYSIACHHIDIEATYTRVVDVVCSWNNTQQDACDNIHIMAEHSRNQVNILCDGDMACKHIYISAQYANIVNVNGMGAQALYSGEIHAEYATKVSVLFYAKALLSLYDDYWEYQPYDFMLYLPEKHNGNLSRITCQGFGCNELNIASPNGLTDYDINLNGCGLCDEKYYCYYDWNIFCGNDFENKLTVWEATSCYDDICGCKESIKVLQESWDNNNQATCTDIEYYDYECKYDEFGWCVIECDDCMNKMINATNEKTSVIINCGGNGLCQRTKIYCPKKDDIGCIINCLEDDSCTYAKIYSDTASNSLWLNCSDYGSCQFTKVIAPKLAQIDIFCDNSDSCYGLNVEATYTGTVNVICKPSQQSYHHYNYYWNHGYYDDYTDWEYEDDYRGGYPGGGRRRMQDINGRYDADHDGKYSWSYNGDIDYDPTWSVPSMYACDQIVVDANYSTYFNIFCDGDSSCYYSLFYGEHAQNVNITAVGINSFQYDTLYAQNAGDLYVKCSVAHNMSEHDDINNIFGACGSGYFHIPSDDTMFVCQGYGCYGMTIDINNDMGVNDINIEVDGCHVCSSVEECIKGWDIYCGKNHHYDRLDDQCSKYTCECIHNVKYQNTLCNSSLIDWSYPDWPIMRYHTNVYGIISCVSIVVLCFGVMYCCAANQRKKRRRLNEMNNARDNVHNAMPMDMDYRVSDNNIVALEPVEGQSTVIQNPMHSVSTVNPSFVAVGAHSQKAKGDDANAGLIQN